MVWNYLELSKMSPEYHQNTPDKVIEKVFGEFTDQTVKHKPKDGFNNIDDTQMTYYADYTTLKTQTSDLLTTGDGQCSAWAKLFIDALRTHKINEQDEYIEFYGPNTSTEYGFFVKNWTFTGTGRSGNTQWPYLNVPNFPFPDSTSYPWKFAEVTDNAGIAGQGTSNPASLFNNHQIVKLKGKYYDPSYGSTFTSLSDIENNAIEGYFKIVQYFMIREADIGADLNNNGTTTDTVYMTVIISKKSTGGNQLQEVLHDIP